MKTLISLAVYLAVAMQLLAQCPDIHHAISDKGIVLKNEDANLELNDYLLINESNGFSYYQRVGTTIPNFVLDDNTHPFEGHLRVNGRTCIYANPKVQVLKDANLKVASTGFNNVKLSWESAMSKNTEMRIERSIDAQRYQSLKNSTASKDQFHKSQYEFIDEQPLEGMNFYRIAQYDESGNLHSTSEVHGYFRAGKYSFTLVNNTLKPVFASTIKEIRLYDELGNYLKEVPIHNKSVQLGKMKNAGYYILKIKYQNVSSAHKVYLN